MRQHQLQLCVLRQARHYELRQLRYTTLTAAPIAPPPHVRPPTAPWNQTYPNWDRVVDDLIPLVCTLLFGFSGGFFAAVASADTAGVGKFAEISQVWGYWHVPGFDRKWYVLLVTGISCLAFYFSLIFAIQSKLLDPLPWKDAIDALGKTDAALKQVNDAALARFVEKQRRYRIVSIMAFNFGVVALPLAGLLFLKHIFAQWIVPIYAVLLLFYAAVTLWRLAGLGLTVLRHK